MPWLETKEKGLWSPEDTVPKNTCQVGVEVKMTPIESNCSMAGSGSTLRWVLSIAFLDRICCMYQKAGVCFFKCCLVLPQWVGKGSVIIPDCGIGLQLCEIEMQVAHS